MEILTDRVQVQIRRGGMTVLESVIRVGGGEGARQVQVYEDEMIRQRA